LAPRPSHWTSLRPLLLAARGSRGPMAAVDATAAVAAVAAAAGVAAASSSPSATLHDDPVLVVLHLVVCAAVPGASTACPV